LNKDMIKQLILKLTQIARTCTLRRNSWWHIWRIE
jgi:hypothetical protein